MKRINPFALRDQKVKTHIPSEYSIVEPITEKIEFFPHQFCRIVGFKTKEEFIFRINEISRVFPGIKIDARTESIVPCNNEYVLYTYDFVWDYLKKYNYSATIAVKLELKDNKYPQFLYRQIGKEYIDSLINNGELLLSTFERCKELDAEQRRDESELKNIVEIGERAKYRFDVSYSADVFLLCTSLPKFKKFQDKQDWVKITHPKAFCDTITKVLTEAGYKIPEVICAPCVYNNKLLKIKDDNLRERIERLCFNNGSINIDMLHSIIYSIYGNHLFLDKHASYHDEREFRFIWKLLNSPDMPNNRIDVKEYDGKKYYILKIPEIKQFIKRIT